MKQQQLIYGWHFQDKTFRICSAIMFVLLLRTITNAPWYVFNQTLHSDLHIPHVRTLFRERTATYHTTLDSHPNPLMEPLVHPPNNRSLKRRWAFDEIHQGRVAGRLLDHRQLDSTLAHRKRRSDVFWLLIKGEKCSFFCFCSLSLSLSNPPLLSMFLHVS
jgi:hypothetical protein